MSLFLLPVFCRALCDAAFEIYYTPIFRRIQVPATDILRTCEPFCNLGVYFKAKMCYTYLADRFKLKNAKDIIITVRKKGRAARGVPHGLSDAA